MQMYLRVLFLIFLAYDGFALMPKYRKRSPRQGRATDPEVCGISSMPDVGDNKELAQCSLPWVVAIKVTDENLLERMCSGAFIAPAFVLTSKNCQREGDRFPKYEVIYNTLNYEKGTALTVHGFHRPKGTVLMLLELIKPVPVKNVICITTILIRELVQSDVIFAGWGTTEDHYRYKQGLLNFEKWKLPDQPGMCGIEKNYTSGDRICAQTYGKDAYLCRGDTGGPVMAQYDGIFYLIGLEATMHVEAGECVKEKQNRFFHRLSATDISAIVNVFKKSDHKYDGFTWGAMKLNKKHSRRR